ncbi:MAG TPA: phosphatase PAP2 family protein [Allosphingosinicella sp.]|nr:phosphatase PAP2 family protein [Allosphingosinicella sp.]
MIVDLTTWRTLLSKERALLLSLLLVAASLFAFLKLASEVAEGDAMAFDRIILLALRSPLDLGRPIGPPWLAEAMTDATAFGSVTGLLLVSVAVLGYLLVSGQPRTALFILLATGSGAAIGKLLKLAYDRPRPTLVPHLVDVTSASFPSGHAVDSAIVYLTLAALVARTVPGRAVGSYVLSLAIFLTLMIGVSRVYLGVHWPSDVVAGWAIGSAWALLCSLVHKRLDPVRAKSAG